MGQGPENQAALQIRRTVFIDEQGIDADLEFDGTDSDKKHYVGYENGRPVTTARVELTPTGWLVQRVATLPEDRHHGYSQQLLTQIISDAAKAGTPQVRLDAQHQAVSFYDRLGFQVAGGAFLEAGIVHYPMIKELL
ncbi:GNAT family N-acetyltransferase [Levilactobacillus bambusae]|uniref:GNAT family N-acetyltransferase n=2 Tax=Levilactobacillus bambusae TaxID=2024736 RepID=A0A2V1N3P8_9LACO|nr:GNAT family N-acetyltransferase [Levilactobacillus bambusae]